MQRAVRRAGIPVEYSAGFNPHSKIAYGPALAVGLGSDGEFMDMELREPIEEMEFIERLNASLPTGLGVTAAEYIPAGMPSLTAVINAAEYSIAGLLEEGSGQDTEQRLKNFFGSDSVLIERTNKRGKKVWLDIIPLITEVKKIEAGNQEMLIELIIDTGSKSNLRPIELVKALERHTGLSIKDVRMHRKRLLIREAGKYFSPLEVSV